ncbi:44598_t:CDS:2 [Gigaspora margarita]|uniref:44598_t:CDS:1 n=1 Tax=Gigaspora margarita TaxID=4874 RepID=A0ABN7UHK5_GIGMA|nr:44598_t:CDS:2 [Gigaspora margarita]
MSRLIHFLILFLAFIWSASAQVTTINTPAGSVAVGSTITITWSYTPSNVLRGTLSVVDSTTRNTVLLSRDLPLSSQSYRWTVNVPAGTYYFVLDDGTGDKSSGTFQVIQDSTTAAVSSGSLAPSGAAPSGSPAPSGAAPSGSPALSGAAPSGSPALSGAAPSGSPAPSGAYPPAQPQSSLSNIGIYIGVAVSGIVGIVVGLIFAFVGYRAYKKHQDSKFIPTPGNTDHNI